MNSEFVVNTSDGQVWCERKGEGKELLILIHGGPGVPSDYLVPLMELEDKFTVIRYDQLGCGRSKKEFSDKLIEIPRFVEELKLILEIAKFEIAHLYGHSWGAIVAAEFVFKYPEKVSSVVFASPATNIPQWRADAKLLRKKLPLIMQMLLSQGERDGNFYSPEYMQAIQEYDKNFVYKQTPIPELVLEADKHSSREIYNTMWGPNECVINGTLKDYDCTEKLSNITQPTLFTCGKEEGSSPHAAELYASKMKNASVKIFEESAHFPHLTENAKYMECLREWYDSCLKNS